MYQESLSTFYLVFPFSVVFSVSRSCKVVGFNRYLELWTGYHTMKMESLKAATCAGEMTLVAL